MGKRKIKMNLLFIAPIFNNYEKVITKTIKSSNNYENVYYMADCPLQSVTLYATFCRLYPSGGLYFFKKHNDIILNFVLANDIDIIYIIKGESIEISTLQHIKKEKPQIKIIIYQWDSIRNNPNAIKLLDFADRTYTFDYVDADSLNINYLPLFYCWQEIGYTPKNTIPVKYDIMSIGGYRDHRMPYVDAMKAFCSRYHMKAKFHNFERFGAYMINFNKNKVKWNDVNFTSIAYKDYLSILNQSACILDIPSPKQEGLTMRTIETLSMGKKLVTTNKNIKKEAFFNDNVFVICSPKDINTSAFLDFLNSPPVNNQGLLSLTEWLNKQGVI